MRLAIVAADYTPAEADPNAQGCTTCWSSTPTGFKYKNKAGTPAGITSLSLKAGATESAQAQIKGKGSPLGPPATADLVTDVVVQLLIDDGVTLEWGGAADSAPLSSAAAT